MKAKNNSTDHRCIELMKWPVLEWCHQVGPMMARTDPVAMMMPSAAIVNAPKT